LTTGRLAKLGPGSAAGGRLRRFSAGGGCVALSRKIRLSCSEGAILAAAALIADLFCRPLFAGYSCAAMKFSMREPKLFAGVERPAGWWGGWRAAKYS
jgi:hypothetical protein